MNTRRGNLSNMRRRGKSLEHKEKGEIFQTREGENLSNTRRGKSFKDGEGGNLLYTRRRGKY